MEIPVFLFTGFLESGKTTFIQEALEDDDFNVGERTLLLLCEEGEVEFEPKKFFGKNVFIEPIEDPSELTPKHMSELQLKHKVERVIVEYNGMWMLDEFYKAMPKEWIVYQELVFFNAETFLTYNKNMRQLVYDKLQSAEMVVFNRCTRGFDKMAFHKIVRGANRKSQIIYEYEKDNVELDQIPDPLPFDINADNIIIEDDAFAEWYRDLNEEQDKYEGKVVTVKGRSVLGGGLDDNSFIFGRHVMTCCVEDIQFAGLVCRWKDAAKTLTHGGWVKITAKISIQYDEMYGENGPVLKCMSVEKAEPADPEVATF